MQFLISHTVSVDLLHSLDPQLWCFPHQASLIAVHLCSLYTQRENSAFPFHLQYRGKKKGNTPSVKISSKRQYIYVFGEQECQAVDYFRFFQKTKSYYFHKTLINSILGDIFLYITPSDINWEG